MDYIYNLNLDERVAHCEKLLFVFDRLPDGCFWQFRTSPSIDLVNRLKNKIHALSEEIRGVKKYHE